MMAVLFMWTLFLHIRDRIGNVVIQGVFFFLFCLAYPVTMAYSRIYMGVHSLNQVVFGGLLGSWLACTFHFAIKTPFMNHIQDLWFFTESEKRMAILKMFTFSVLLLSVETFGFLYRD